MELNKHLAAYGLFQHQFAYLAGELKKTIDRLDPGGKPLGKRPTFGKLLDRLKDLGKKLERRCDPAEIRSHRVADEPADNPFLDLGKWIKKARALACWRNNRVHGRLAFDQSTGAAYLVNEEDRVLDADHATCLLKAREAFQLVDELEDITIRCLHDAELTECLDSLLPGTPDTPI